jgi:hypothetical protein
MKKIFAAAMTLVLFITAGMTEQVFAANELTFTVGSAVSATRGETVTVPITVSNNPGFAVAGLVVTYDPNVLEITGVTAPVAEMPLNSQFALTTVPGTQWIHFINTNLVDWSGDGVVANITFHVKQNAEAGRSAISLAFTGTPNGTPGNANGDILRNAVVVSGSVDVVDSATNGLTFTVGSNVSATRGGTVTVPVTVGNNPGFTAAGFVATYDTNVLEITGVTAPAAAMPLNSQFELTTTPGTQWISLVNTNIVDWSGNGVVVNMTFNVRSNATVGVSPISLAFTSAPDGTPGNANGDILRGARAVSGSVNVANPSNSGGGSSGSSGSSGRSGRGSGNSNDGSGDDSHNTGDNDNDGGVFGGNYQNPSNDNRYGLFDDGGFIGNPYVPLAYMPNIGMENDESGNQFLSMNGPGTGGVGGGSFGKVPQTGTPDIARAAAILFVSLMASVALWVYILRRKYSRDNNANSQT